MTFKNVETAFFREASWHKNGVLLEGEPTVESAMETAQMNWNVLEKPLYADTWQSMILDPLHNETLSPQLVSTHKAIVRDTDNAVLGIVGSGYQPVQNKDAFCWFDFLLESGDATLESGGSVNGGKRIWVLAKAKGQEDEVLKGDLVEAYILLSNAHDGTMGVWLMFTPIRFACMNTLTSALANANRSARMGRAISIKHSANVLDQMEMAKDLINVSQRTFEGSISTYKAFARKKMTDLDFRSYFVETFFSEKELAEFKAQKEVDEYLEKSRAYSRMTELFQSGAGQDIPGVRGTVWAGYNAFTEYIEHERGLDDNRLNSSWFGGGGILRNKAYQNALALVR